MILAQNYNIQKHFNKYEFFVQCKLLFYKALMADFYSTF
jgi:hypothetical protein